MLFPNPNKEKIEEQVTDQKVLLQEVLNDKPKKIEKIDELFNHEPPSFTD